MCNDKIKNLSPYINVEILTFNREVLNNLTCPYFRISEIPLKNRLKNKRMYITKQTQTHRCREQTSGFLWGEGKGEGRDSGMGLRDTNYCV